MSKNPAFQFYPGDWTRDLDDQDLEIEGAWIRICCRLWWSPKKGEARKNLTEWSYILRTHPNKTKVILKTLLGKGIATGEYLDNQNITIISRRMVRDYEISQIRREVGKLGGNPGLMKIKENLDNLNLSKTTGLQSSSSSSVKNITSKEEQAAISFTLPSKEEIQESSDPRIEEYIKQVCVRLYEEKIFPEVHAFKNKMLKGKKNGRGILHVLTRCYLSRPDDPWAYCQSVISKEDGNYNERDYRKTAQ